MNNVYLVKFLCLSLLWTGVSEGNPRRRLLDRSDGSPPPVELMLRDAPPKRPLHMLKKTLKAGCCPLGDPLDNADMQAKCVACDMHVALLSSVGGLACWQAGVVCSPHPVGPALMVCGEVAACVGTSWCVADSARRVCYLLYSCR